MALTPSGSAKKVIVSIRVRPLIQREKDADEKVNWYLDGNLIQQYQQGTSNGLTATTPYAFDYIFGQEAKTSEVYEKVVAPLVQKSLQGFNGTVLCYGQTSSGKTFTLFGSDEEPGIISLTAQDLFNRFSDDSRSYFVKIGLLEVYNEKLSDMMDDGKLVDIKEVNGEVIPKGLKEIEVLSPEDMLEAANRIQAMRKIGETRMNKESSRSHTILRIMISSVSNDDADEDRQVTSALLNFVDLAGSEKASQTGSQGERFKEGTFINKSLLALSHVVNQLSSGNPVTGKPPAVSAVANNPQLQQVGNLSLPNTAPPSSSKSSKFVNFRDSKLTRILQSSLSGNAFIGLICNVTPASIEETHSTLRFARTAKTIKVDPTKNLGTATSSEYESKILALEKQLSGKSSEVDKLRKELASMQRFVQPKTISADRGGSNQVERRRTLCPSMLSGFRQGLPGLPEEFIQDNFKIIKPRSPVRRSLFATTKNTHKSTVDIPFFEVNHEFPPLEDQPGPTPPKVAKVDAQTCTDFPALPAFVHSSQLYRHTVDRNSRPDLNQSAFEEIQTEKSFIIHERSLELEELNGKFDALQETYDKVQSNYETLQSEHEILQKLLSDREARSKGIMGELERLQEEKLTWQSIQADYERLQEEKLKWQSVQLEFERLQEEKLKWQSVQSEFERLQEENLKWQSVQSEFEGLQEEKLKWQSAQADYERLKEENQKWQSVQPEFERLQEEKLKWQSTQADYERLQEEKLKWQSIQPEFERLQEEKIKWKSVQLELERLQEEKLKWQSVQSELECLQEEKLKWQSVQSELERLQKEKVMWQSMESDYERLQEENLSRAEFLKEIQEEVSSLRAKLFETEEDLMQAKNLARVNEDVRAKHEELLAHNQKLRTEGQEVKSEVELLKGKLAEVELGQREQLAAQAQKFQESFQSQLEQLQTQLRSAQEEVEAVRKENLSLKSELELSNASSLTLREEQERQAEHHLMEIEKLREDIQNSRAEARKRESEAEEGRIKYEKALDILAKVERELDVAQKDRDSLQSQLNSLQGQLDGARDSAEQLEEQLRLIRAENENIHSGRLELERLRAEHEELSCQFETITMKLQGVECERDDIRSEAETMYQKLSELESERAHSEILKAQLESAQGKLLQLEAAMEAARIERDTAQAELLSKSIQAGVPPDEDMREQLKVLEAQVVEARVLYDTALEQLGSYKEEFKAQFENTRAHVLTLESQREQLRGQLDSSREQLQTLESERNELSAQLHSNREQLQSLESERNDLTAQLDNYREQVRAEKQLLESQLTQLREQLGALESNNAELQEERQTSRQHALTLETEIGGLRLQVESCEQQIMSLESDKRVIQAELDALRNDCRAHTEEAARLEREHHDISGQFKTLSSKLEATQAELHSAEEQKVGLEVELNELRSQLSSATTENNDRVDLLEQNNQALILRLQVLSQKNTDIQLELDQIRAENEDLSEKFLSARAEFTALQAELTVTLEMKSSLEVELENLTEKLASISKTEDDAATLLQLRLDELQTENSGMKTALATAKEEVASAESLKTQFQQQIATLQADHQMATALCDQLSATNQELASRLENTADELATIQLEFKTVKSELEATHIIRDSLKAQIEEYRSELEVAKAVAATADELRRTNCALLHEMEQIRSQVVGGAQKEEEEQQLLKVQLEDAQRMNGDLEGKLASLQAAFEEMTKIAKEREEAAGAARDALARADHLQVQLETKEAQVTELSLKIQKLTLELKEASEKLGAAESEFEVLKAERELAMEENSSLRAEREIAISDHSTLRAERDNAISENSSLRAERDIAIADNSSLRAERDIAISENSSLRAERDIAISENSSLKDDREAATAAIMKLEADRDQLTAQLRTLSSKLGDLEAEHETISLSLAEALRVKVSQELQVESLTEQLLLKNQEFEEEKRRSRADLESLRADRKELEEQIQIHRADSLKFQAEKEDAAAKYEKVFALLTTTQEDLEVTQKLKDSLQSTLETLEKSAGEVGGLRKRQEFLCTQVANLSELNRTLKSESDQLQSDKAHLSIQLENVQRQLATAQSRQESLDKELKSTQESAQNQILVLRTQLETLQNSRDNQVEELRVELAAATALATRATELQLRIDSLLAELEPLKEENKSLQLRVQSLSSENREVRGKLAGESALLSQADELRRKLESARRGAEGLERSNAELSSQLKTLTEVKTALERSAEESAQLRSSLEKKVEKLEADLVSAGECDQRSSGRPSRRSVGLQVGNSIDIFEKLRAYQIHAARMEKQRDNAEMEKKRINYDLKLLQEKHSQNEKEIEIFKVKIVSYADECDRLKEVLKAAEPPETSEAESQCDLALEMLQRARVFPVQFPKGWPDLHQLYNQNTDLRREIAQLDAANRKCTCKDQPQRFKYCPPPIVVTEKRPSRPTTGILASRPTPPNVVETTLARHHPNVTPSPVPANVQQQSRAPDGVTPKSTAVKSEATPSPCVVHPPSEISGPSKGNNGAFPNFGRVQWSTRGNGGTGGGGGGVSNIKSENIKPNPGCPPSKSTEQTGSSSMTSDSISKSGGGGISGSKRPDVAELENHPPASSAAPVQEAEPKPRRHNIFDEPALSIEEILNNL